MSLTFVQVKTASASAAVLAVPFTSNTTGSSYLLAAVFWVPAGGSCVAVDTLLNTWIPITTAVTIGAVTAQLFHVPINKGSGGADTVTFTVSGVSPSNLSVTLLEYTGQSASNPIDTIASWVTGNTTTGVSPTVETSWTNETIIVFGLGDGSTAVVGSGFALRANGASNFWIAEDKAVAAPGAYFGTWTQTSPGWDAIALGLKSSTSAFAGNSSWLQKQRKFVNKRG